MFERITSRVNRISSGSTAYSRLRWYPRRATFSVRMDRPSSSTVKPCAIVTATSSGSIMLTSCVSSSANTTPVNGDRIVPPRIAPMLTSGQKPAPSAGNTIASSPPSAPPIISSGASTPPDVPDPSENDQMIDFTISTPRITRVVADPCKRLEIVS